MQDDEIQSSSILVQEEALVEGSILQFECIIDTISQVVVQVDDSVLLFEDVPMSNGDIMVDDSIQQLGDVVIHELPIQEDMGVSLSHEDALVEATLPHGDVSVDELQDELIMNVDHIDFIIPQEFQELYCYSYVL